MHIWPENILIYYDFNAENMYDLLEKKKRKMAKFYFCTIEKKIQKEDSYIETSSKRIIMIRPNNMYVFTHITLPNRSIRSKPILRAPWRSAPN